MNTHTQHRAQPRNNKNNKTHKKITESLSRLDLSIDSRIKTRMLRISPSFHSVCVSGSLYDEKLERKCSTLLFLAEINTNVRERGAQFAEKKHTTGEEKK